tara:strand:- start:64 stop:444 length:381 start_codon:yes stop_codon:yes gene_type:complete
MSTEEIKDILPYLLGIVSTILALNKEFISSKIFRIKSRLDISSSAEDVESKQLDNVEREIRIYRDLLDDTKKRFETTILDLKIEIDELNKLVREQRLFIQKQSKSLDYFEKKCIGRKCEVKEIVNE